jgi:hypothetical protein
MVPIDTNNFKGDIYNLILHCERCGADMEIISENSDVTGDNFPILGNSTNLDRDNIQRIGAWNLLELDEHFEFIGKKMICKTKFTELLVDFKIDLWNLTNKELYSKLTKGGLNV